MYHGAVRSLRTASVRSGWQSGPGSGIGSGPGPARAARYLTGLRCAALALLLGGCTHAPQLPCEPRIYALRADSTIELTVNGVSGHFLLDTGANVSALEPDWARAVTSVRGSEVTLDGLQLGGVPLLRPRFKLEPLAASYVGTLGTDILRRFLITFDYHRGHVELSPVGEHARCTPDAGRYQPIPFSFFNAVPFIALRIGEKTIRALVDTGAWYEYVGIKQSLIEQLGERLHFVKNVYIVSTHGRKLQPSFMGLPVRIGALEVHAPIVQDDANILGLHILRRFGRFTIDFAQNALWVDRVRI